MKLILLFALQSAFLLSKSNHFDLNSGNSIKVIHSSSLWLSDMPMINPMNNNRLFFELGLITTHLNSDMYKYFNINTGLKISENLLLNFKSYSFRSNHESPQVIGGGIQYYFGEKDSPNWSFALQRNDLKGISNFSLSSITIDLRKWYNWNFLHFCLGLGSNFFKEHIFLQDYLNSDKIRSQINFMGLGCSLPIGGYIIGVKSKFTTSMTVLNIFLQKEIF